MDGAYGSPRFEVSRPPFAKRMPAAESRGFSLLAAGRRVPTRETPTAPGRLPALLIQSFHGTRKNGRDYPDTAGSVGVSDPVRDQAW
jgi:hypothetical protein